MLARGLVDSAAGVILQVFHLVGRRTALEVLEYFITHRSVVHRAGEHYPTPVSVTFHDNELVAIRSNGEARIVRGKDELPLLLTGAKSLAHVVPDRADVEGVLGLIDHDGHTAVA